MNRDRKICREPTCYAFGKFCLRPGHSPEVITPYVKPKKENDKRKEENNRYRKEARRFITLHPKCGVCGQAATEVHHKAGRVGELLLDQTRWMAVCPDCHMRITEDSAWAIEMGYSESRLKASS